MRYKILILLTLIILFALGFTDSLEAQCAMCKANLQTDLSEGGTIGKGINKGILYLMAIPYILMFIIGFALYKNLKASK